MTTDGRLRQGTAAWFQMVGQLMSEAAARSGPAADVSLVERYTDGAELADGLVQGVRFDIADGKPSFRVGARADERADITVEVSAAAARRLNSLRSADPEYQEALEGYLRTGEMRVVGDMSRIGAWIEAVHDPIVDRTE